MYGIIAVVSVLLCLATYFFLYQQNQTDETNGDESNDNQSSYKVAIVDHLSRKEETENETFKNSSIGILETAGFNVTYYPGDEVTVNFFRNLVSNNHGLIVLRVHSAIVGDSTNLGLFTWEVEDENKYNTPSAPYYDDVLNKRIVRAYLPDDSTPYFAIAPGFVQKYGDLQDATVIMMGCDGLKHATMAEAFVEKGAKVCIGWDGLVSTSHTDRATTRLLQHLAQGNTLGQAVEKTMDEVGPEEMYVQDQGYESILKYYPRAAGSYTIQSTIYGAFGTISTRANTVLAKEQKRAQLNRS